VPDRDAATVLVIDDDPDFRREIVLCLSEHDYDVRQADSGQEGLRLFQDAAPDLVLLDIRMPGLSGVKVLEKLRRLSAETPVIMVTASEDFQDVVAALKLGASDYLTKPVQDTEILLHAIRRALQTSRLARLYRELQDNLHGMVQQRTAELRETNQALQEANQALAAKNTALREVLDSIESQKREAAEAIGRQIDEVVLPMLHAQMEHFRPVERQRLGEVEQALREVASPYLDRLLRSLAALSPSERRLCQMIRRGLSNKEIAALANLSPQTVKVHRRNIRRKLGLTNTDADLGTYLDSLMNEPDL